MNDNSNNTPVEGSIDSLNTNPTQYNEVFVKDDDYDSGFPITPEVVYLTIPIAWIPTYRRLISLIASAGKSVIDDCSYGCKGNGSVVFNCWNIFQSACAAKANGQSKQAQLFIDYVDKQIESYNKANNIKVTDTSFKYIITPDGKCLADGVIKDDVVNLSLDSKNKEIYDNYIKNKDNGKVYTEGD